MQSHYIKGNKMVDSALWAAIKPWLAGIFIVFGASLVRWTLKQPNERKKFDIISFVIYGGCMLYLSTLAVSQMPWHSDTKQLAVGVCILFANEILRGMLSFIVRLIPTLEDKADKFLKDWGPK
jgi:hypothetical protein